MRFPQPQIRAPNHAAGAAQNPLPPEAEAKIIADDKNGYTKTFNQDFLYVAIGTQAANLFIKIQLKYKIDPETFQQLQLFWTTFRRPVARPQALQKLFRMRFQQNNQVGRFSSSARCFS